LIIDTKNPEIGTYTLKINGSTIGSYCAPTEAKPLVISLETDEPLTATGAYYVDVYNAGNVRVNRLNLIDNGGTLEAYWDAKNDSGSTVSDGVYTFRVSDLCGNSSSNATSTTAITSPFQVMSPAVQTGSNTIKLWFNHGIDPASLGSTPISCKPPLTISDIHIEDERAIAFTATGMNHGASYTLTVQDSISNIYGSTLSTTASSATFFADVKGPAIVETNYDRINSQGEIRIVFDQPLDKTTSQATSSYIIQDSSGNSIPITSVILQSDGQTVLLVASGTFIENADYTIKAPGVKDELGNSPCETSLTGFSFKGRDVTPPKFIISAFSNAANENDIIIIAVSNEELIRVPTVTIYHGTASPKSLVMQKNEVNPLAFMAAASLKATNGQSGTLKVEGEDLNSNKGSDTDSFVIANVKTSSSLRLASTDEQFSLSFDKDSLKADATVKILKRNIVKDENATGTIRTALQNEYTVMRGLRASVASQEEEATNSELTPLTDAYEATISSTKINKGVVASMKVPESASQTTGIGLFYQKNGSWKFISSNITTDKEIKARITSSQIFAIMKDSVAPSIKLDESLDLSKAFETARPEFAGTIKDFGSGIDTNSLEAKIDNNVQSLSLDNNGNFKFKSLSELINGNHDLTITAKDRTGNLATSGSMRFALVLPFEFRQIIQYPNPAKNNLTIRIRTNSTGINCNIRIKIYDVAGHKVADFDESDVVDKNDGNYEVRWDLRNKKGKKVANGVYIAKLEAINPETGKKVKATLKLAVLK
ncbi:MAG: Ig-like domain-containing protein, partial [Candidatus Riflebacteria bacterium]|nr:Ig-like domain-containing protein [Candidatus Riflebacteria bacterium]